MTIEFIHATLGYGQKKVLSDVNLTFTTGSTTCVIGKNGAGKTTLFKSLLGLLPLLEGDIRLDGRSLRQLKRLYYARAVAYVPQARALPFEFTAFEVALFGRAAHLPFYASPRSSDRRIVAECFEQLHITHLRDRIFTRLSGGEQQMVIIARALAQQPSFLVMDEPASSLDFGNQAKIISLVNSLKNGSTGIIMATHNPDHAFMCNADVIAAHNGTVRRSVITENLLRNIYDVDNENK
jgi:iron complex transport system ATP-binding protein